MPVLHTEDFADITGYTESGTGSAAANTDYKYLGNQCVLLSCVGLYHWDKADIGIVVDASVADTWARLVYYCPAPPGYPGDPRYGGWFHVKFFSGGSLSNYADVNMTVMYPGWHVYDVDIPQTGSGAYDPSNITGIGFYFEHDVEAYVYMCSVQIMRPETTDLPAIIWTFDDGTASQYNTIAPILDAYGWKGCFAVCGSGSPAIGGAGYMTLANLLELQANGHHVVNHTWDHTIWTGLTTDEREYEVLRNQRWLQDNGLAANADILTFAYGFYMCDAADLDMCLRLNRCLIETSSKIFLPHHTLAAYQTSNYAFMQQWSPIPYRQYIRRLLFDTQITTSAIDAAIAACHKSIVPLGIHKVVTPLEAGNLTVAEFQAVCDHVRELELAGTCKVIGIDEWIGQNTKIAPASLSGLTFVDALKILAANQETIKAVQPDFQPTVDAGGNTYAVDSSGEDIPDATAIQAAAAAALTAFPAQKSGVPVTAPANMALDSTVAKAATALSNATWTDEKAGFLDAPISDVETPTNVVTEQTNIVTE